MRDGGLDTVKLPFLENYSGQTTEELLALEGRFRTDSLVLAFEEALNQKAERQGAHLLTREEQYVLAIEALEREVNNGGYDQLLLNPSRRYMPIILEALEATGCTEALEITREVLSVLQLPPTFTEAELMAAHEAFTGDSGSAFDAWDARYYAEAGDLAPQVLGFIRNNLPHVRVP